MRIMSSRVHGYLDYVTVAGFALAPSLIGLAGAPKWVCYMLAGVHLLLTLLTDFPLGARPLIPLKVHGVIEFVVSIVLIVLPWVLGFSAYAAARNFFLAAGITIFIVWLLTDYNTKVTE